MQKLHSAGGVVVGPNKKVLVVSQHGDTWSLPKGIIDPGEDAMTAAIRETREESGVTDLRLIKSLGSYERYRIGKDPSQDDTTTLKHITMFLFTTAQLDLAPEDPDNPEARWVEPRAVTELLTHPKDKEFYERIFFEVEALIAD